MCMDILAKNSTLLVYTPFDKTELLIWVTGLSSD